MGSGGRKSAGRGLAIVKFRFLLLLLFLGFFPHHRFVHVISIARPKSCSLRSGLGCARRDDCDRAATEEGECVG